MPHLKAPPARIQPIHPSPAHLSPQLLRRSRRPPKPTAKGAAWNQQFHLAIPSSRGISDTDTSFSAVFAYLFSYVGALAPHVYKAAASDPDTLTFDQAMADLPHLENWKEAAGAEDRLCLA